MNHKRTNFISCDRPMSSRCSPSRQQQQQKSTPTSTTTTSSASKTNLRSAQQQHLQQQQQASPKKTSNVTGSGSKLNANNKQTSNKPLVNNNDDLISHKFKTKPLANKLHTDEQHQLSNNKASVDADIRSSKHANKACLICAQSVPGPEREKIFAFGKCNHPVCYVCCARLRVLCEQLECPICREKLESVIFSATIKPHDQCSVKSYIYNASYNVFFASESIKQAFHQLFKYECLVCVKKHQKQASSKDGNKSSSVTTKFRTSNSIQNSAKENTEPANNTNSQQIVSKFPSASATGDKSSKPVKDTSANIKSQQDNCATHSPVAQPNSTSAPTPHPPPPATPQQQCDVNANSCHTNISELPAQANDDGNSEAIKDAVLAASDPRKYVFDDLFNLRNHLHYCHQLKLCDFCLSHNKVFPFEYNYYDKLMLLKHVSQGEKNTPHRGHPICKLCRQTFFNQDELMTHMARDHFYCHFCGRSSSSMRIYFLDYDSLRTHFKANHYLCERGNCRNDQFTSAFENDIDYQMHLVNVHGNPSSHIRGSEARQQRTIQLDSASYRPVRQTSPMRNIRQNLPENAVITTLPLAVANSSLRSRSSVAQSQVAGGSQPLPSRAEFPLLSDQPSSNSCGTQRLQQASSTSAGNSLLTVTAGPSNARNSFVHSLRLGAAHRIVENEFPPLPDQPKKQKNKQKKQQQQQPNQKAAKESINRHPQSIDQLFSLATSNSLEQQKSNSKKNSNQKAAKQRPLKFQIS